MKHITVVCDFCKETIANYDEYAGMAPMEFSEVFGGHACERCHNVMGAEAQKVLQKVLEENKRKEGKK